MKHVEKLVCRYCESDYKVIYYDEESTGQTRFCPFCGEEPHDVIDDLMEDIDD